MNAIDAILSPSYRALWRLDLSNDEPVVMVDCINSTPEPISFDPGDDEGYVRLKGRVWKRYWMRVHPELRPLLLGKVVGEKQKMTARNAVASLSGLRGEEYDPVES